jgi:hypothetical protein
MTRTFAAAIFALLAITAPAANAAGAYEGQISGDFHGWDGETVYKLMDGHIIQQTEYHYHYHYAYAPHVIIISHAAGATKFTSTMMMTKTSELIF